MYKIGQKEFKNIRQLMPYSVVSYDCLYKRLNASPPWKVEDAISYLPHEVPNQDRIIFLHKTGKYTKQMIADITGIPVRTVKNILEK